MKFTLSFLIAALATTSASAGLVKRIDNRILVVLPTDVSIDDLRLEWKGACLATVGFEAPGAVASFYTELAPGVGQANVFCTSTPTTRFTDEVIGYLGLTKP